MTNFILLLCRICGMYLCSIYKEDEEDVKYECPTCKTKLSEQKNACKILYDIIEESEP